MFKFNKSSGQASRLLLVLAVIILVAVIIVYLVVKMAQKPPAPVGLKPTPIALPVYETQLGDIKFIFESGLDRGNLLKASQIVNSQFLASQYSSSYVKDLPTTEKFIQVTVGAQNEGADNTLLGAWDIENIVDSKGRNFVPLDNNTVAPWLPFPNLCGVLLKPAFDPTPCTKIYEVSKESSGLKIRVITGLDNLPNNLSSGKIDSFLIDLIVK